MADNLSAYRQVLLCLVLLAVVGCQAAEVPDKPYRDPAGFESEIAQFESLDARTMPPAGAVVCVGSSSMRLWHDALANDLSPLTVIGRGFGGSNMNDLLFFADRIVLNYQPRAVLIYEGDNDIAQGVSPRRVDATFKRLVGRIHERFPDCRIYMLAIKPSPARWELWPLMREANELLRQRCQSDGRLTYIDIATPMLGADGRPRAGLYVEDGLHLTRAGYDLWREVVGEAMVGPERRFEVIVP